eukprot:g19486.t1
MTYSYSKYSYKSSYSYTKSYEWTAYTESDFLGPNTGSSISCGDTFTMPGGATVCMSTYDNDGYLSGDAKCNENATDSYGQKAYVDGQREGGQMYAECYHVLKGSDGRTYYLIEIEVEGYDAPGAGDDFFTFYGAVPPKGVELTVVNTCNVKGCMIDYRCLGAGEKAPANTPPEFTNDPKYGKICIDENTAFVIDLNANDADGDTLTYEIIGGKDADKFQIDASTGELTFKEAPDYENPTDYGQDNVYDVQVRVTDGKGGEDTTCLSICVEDVQEGQPKCIVIEAEDMCAWGFSKAWGCNASGGKLMKLGCAGGEGVLWTKFTGEAGTYDLKLFVQDENDGQSKIYIKVNGEVVKTVVLDNDNNGAGSNNGYFSEIVLDDIELKPCDTLSIWADGNCGEYVRIDKIELCKDDAPLGSIGDRVWFDADKDGVQDAGEDGVAGVTVNLLDAGGNVIATQATDANGNYLFENLEAGDYKVDFDLPAGTFGFTTQDVGDDALDSDADASGQTATITLAAGENNLTVDAGIIDLNTAPEPVADEAMTCADQVKTVDVLANDFDFDGDTLIITKVDGQAISEGQTITTSAGTLVTLTGGELVIDGEAAYAALDIGEKDVEVISYTVADGNGGTATTDLTMTFCGDANTLESFCASLPETMDYQIVSDQTFPLDPSSFEIKISNSGDTRLDGVIFENAYCLSFYEEVAEGGNYTDAPMNSGTVLCSTDADVASVFNPNQISVFNGNTAAENMDLINWILNQNFEGNGYSGWEVQRAIWELTDDRDLGYMDNVEDMGEDVNVQEILNLASAHEGYVPSMGGNIGLIVDPGDANELNLQPFIVSVNIEQYDCLC